VTVTRKDGSWDAKIQPTARLGPVRFIKSVSAKGVTVIPSVAEPLIRARVLCVSIVTWIVSSRGEIPSEITLCELTTLVGQDRVLLERVVVHHPVVGDEVQRRGVEHHPVCGH
jgi:hypothetical protein